MSLKDEFKAGKIAGLYLVAHNDEARWKILADAPPNLLKRIKEIITYQEELEASTLAKEIARLKTKVERHSALQKVPVRLLTRVKSTVISIFEQSKTKEN